MGATSSAQRDSRGEGEERHADENYALEKDSAKEKLLQNNDQISSLNGEAVDQSEGLSDQCKKKILVDDRSTFVSTKENAPQTTQSLQKQDVSQANRANFGWQVVSRDDITADDENVISNNQNDSDVGFKKIFRFGGFKFTLRKDKVDRTNAEKPARNEQDKEAAGSSVESWDTIEGVSVSTNVQDERKMRKHLIRGEVSTESTETDNREVIGQISEITEHSEKITSDKREMDDAPQNPELEEPMSPMKRFLTQRIFGSLKRKKKLEETLKENNEELKIIDKNVEICANAQEDRTCACLDVSNITLKEDKDVLTQKRDENKSTTEEKQINFQEKDAASPFKRLFRKLSTRKHKEIAFAETSLTETEENFTENGKLLPELLHKEKEAIVVDPKDVDESLITGPEESKKRSDSIVSWEALICGGSLKRRARKTSDSEDETQNKGELTRETRESPIAGSSEGSSNHVASSNEQIGGPAETDNSTWKSLKKLMTPKRKGKLEESGSSEQISSETEHTRDESTCSIRKLISVHRKMKSGMQSENLSFEEESKGIGADNEDDETPLIIPLFEYEASELESFQVMTEKTLKSTTKKEVHTMIDKDTPNQKKPPVNSLYDAGPSAEPISLDYVEELTEFISKYQQLSDIPEEGIFEESVVTPVSFVEWTSQDSTLAEDVADMTADAVTAPEHATEESDGDETIEMVSALSQLTDSQITSGNVSPDTPMCDLGEPHFILQELVETICMTPSALSIIINDPDALALSVSQHLLESTTTTQTKVLATHGKEEATSICIGLVPQDMRDVGKILHWPLVEEMIETNEAVPTELVSVDLTEESDAAKIVTNKVYEAEIKDLKAIPYQALPLEPNTIAENVKKSAQQILNSKEDKVSCVIHMEERKEYSALNSQDLITVDAKAQSEALLYEEPGNLSDRSKPERESALKTVSEEPAHNTEVTGHRHSDVKPPATIVQAVLDDVAKSATNNVRSSVFDKSKASEITDDDFQVPLADCVQLVAEKAAVSLSQSKASKITGDDVNVTQAKDTVFEANNVISSVPDSTLIKATEITEDAVQVNKADHAELVAHNNALAVPPSTVNRDYENTEDVVQVTQAEGAVWIIENVVLSVPGTLNEASEIAEEIADVALAEDDAHVALAEDVELAANKDEVAVSDNDIIKATEITELVFQVALLENFELVANSVVLVPDSTSSEAPRITEDVVKVTQAEDTELVANNDLSSVHDSDLDEASDIKKEVTHVILAEDLQLLSVPHSTINSASKNAGDLVQVTQAEDAVLVVQKFVVSAVDNTLNKATATIVDVGTVEVTRVEDAELIAHNDLVSMAEETLREDSEIMEGFIKVNQDEYTVLIANNAVSSVPDCTINESSGITENAGQFRLDEDDDLVAHKDALAVAVNTLREASEIMEDDVAQTEGTLLVAYNDVLLVPNSTLNEGSEIKEATAQATLVENIELVAHHDVVSVSDSILREASEIMKDVFKITQAEDAVFVANDASSLTDLTLNEAQEIMEDAFQVTQIENIELVSHKVASMSDSMSEIILDIKVTQGEGAVLVKNNVISLGTDSTLNKASKMTEDAVQVTLVEKVELAAISDVVSVPGSTFREGSKIKEDVVRDTQAESDVSVANNVNSLVQDLISSEASKMIEDVVHVTLAEEVELIAQNDVVSVSDSTLDEASEITEDAVQIPLGKDVELIANHYVVSVPDSTIPEASEIKVDVGKIIQTESVGLVANNFVSSVTECTLNEALEMIEDVVQVTLVQDVQLVAQHDVISVSYNHLNEASKITEDAVQVRLAENVELGEHKYTTALPHSTIKRESDSTEDIIQVMMESVELAAYNDAVLMSYTTLKETSEIPEDGVQVTLAKDIELAANIDVVSTLYSTLKDGSEIIEDAVQVTLVGDFDLIAQNAAVSVPHVTLHEGSEFSGDVAHDTLAGDVLSAHNIASFPLSSINRVSKNTDNFTQSKDTLCDSTLNKASEITADNVQVTQTEVAVSAGHSVAVLVPDRRLYKASENIEDVAYGTLAHNSVLAANTNLVSVPDRTLHDVSQNDLQVSQNKDVELGACNVELVSHSTIIMASENTENQAVNTVLELNRVVFSIPDCTLDEASETTRDVNQEKELTDTYAALVQAHKRKSAGGEIFMITLNENKSDEQSHQAPAISELPNLYEEFAEDEYQPLTVENAKPESELDHYTFSKLSVDTHPTEFKREQSAMTEKIESHCVGGESLKTDTLSENLMRPHFQRT